MPTDDQGPIPKYCPVNEAIQYSSPLITLKQFREQCKDIFKDRYNLSKTERSATSISKTKRSILTSRTIVIDQSATPEEKNAELVQLLNTDTATVEELEEVCSIDNLKVFSPSGWDKPFHDISLEYKENCIWRTTSRSLFLAHFSLLSCIGLIVPEYLF